MSGSDVRMPCIDDDAAIDIEPGRLWPAPTFGRMPTAITTSVAGMIVPSASSTPSTLPLPTIALVLALGHHLDAARFDGALQQVAGGRVELTLHQRRHDVQHGHVHVLHCQARRRFEPEQAAADDHRLCPRLCGEQHGVDVVEVAIGEDAGQIVAGHRNDERHRAGGDDELVVARR